MSTPAKALSVDKLGQPDGFVPASFYKPEVLHGGFTRVSVSVPPDGLEAVHKALVKAMSPPFKLLYRQLTDREQGVQLQKPKDLVAVELGMDKLLGVLERYRALIYEDGRHQLWLRSSLDEQVVLEEIGMIYIYPDDLLFRDVLGAHGIGQGAGASMADRDYIRVRFDAANDEEEAGIIQELNLVHWDRGGA